MKQLKVKNWTSCIKDRNKWKLYVEKAITSKKNEVVAPKEEDGYCSSSTTDADCKSLKRNALSGTFVSSCRFILKAAGRQTNTHDLRIKPSTLHLA